MHLHKRALITERFNTVGLHLPVDDLHTTDVDKFSPRSKQQSTHFAATPHGTSLHHTSTFPLYTKRDKSLMHSMQTKQHSFQSKNSNTSILADNINKYNVS